MHVLQPAAVFFLAPRSRSRWTDDFLYPGNRILIASPLKNNKGAVA